MTISYSPSNKGFYDSKLNYSSLPGDLIDVTDIHMTLLKEINSNNKTIVIDGGELFLEERAPVQIEETWDNVRAKRNRLLNDSDYTQLPDYPDALKADWVAYRQLLRDLPQTYTDLSTIVWPTKPSL